jgi:acetyl-CoA acetyltransferase
MAPSEVVILMLHELERRQAKRGLATPCVSSGMGMAIGIEIA